MCVPRYEMLFTDLNPGDSGNATCGEGFEIGGQVCLARTPMLTMVEYHVISEDEQRDEAVELQRRERSTRSKFDTEGGVHVTVEGEGQIPN